MRRGLLVSVALGSLVLGAATFPASADLDRRVSFQLIEVITTDTVIDPAHRATPAARSPSEIARRRHAELRTVRP